MDGYSLSRQWFQWCFLNPEKITPTHTAIYLFAVEQCNYSGWKEKFHLATHTAMEALGINRIQTYTKYLNDLCEWEFITMVEKSKNQYTSNIVSLNAMPKNDTATVKAMFEQPLKQCSSNCESTRESNDTIYKLINYKTNKLLNEEQVFTILSYFDNLSPSDLEKEIKNLGNKKAPQKNKGFVPPTVDELKQYFSENGYSDEAAQKAFNYYSVAGWKDSKGNAVKNWKQKMQSVWFKPENKSPVRKSTPQTEDEVRAAYVARIKAGHVFPLF